ncbi:MAG: hypothetical protein ACI9MR_002148 [Myxococcota bacterium]|jgi:hypothetical protein
MTFPIIVTVVFALAIVAAAWMLFHQPFGGGRQSDVDANQRTGRCKRQARVTAIEPGQTDVTVRVRLIDANGDGGDQTLRVPRTWPGLSELAVGSVIVVSHPRNAPATLTLEQDAPIVTVSTGVVARG